VEGKKPSEWLRQDATKAFVECVAASLEEGQNLVQTKKGGVSIRRGTRSRGLDGFLLGLPVPWEQLGQA
jgi:hypothetical protein